MHVNERRELMTVSIGYWIVFFVFVVVMLGLDLGVVHRKDEVPTMKSALLETGFWVLLAFIFCGIIWVTAGQGHAIDFLTGYLLEESLSIDNLFIFILVFAFFGIKPQYQHRVLFWGIFGALVMRLLFIIGGAALLQRFAWLMYVFGAFLIYTGVSMFFKKDQEQDLDQNKFIRFLRRILPVKDDVQQPHFLVHENGKTYVTQFLLALIFIEASDLMFATDSIPAVLAVTQDTFIVVTSNIFAIMGLRSLYFAIAGLLPMFRYIKYGIAGILTFIGLKMVLNEVGKMFGLPLEISNLTSLGVIVGLLIISIGASVIVSRNEEHTH